MLGIILLVLRRKNDESKDIMQLLLEERNSVKHLSELIDKQVKLLHEGISQQISSNNNNRQQQLEAIQKQLIQIAQLNESKIENMRKTLEDKVGQMQQHNQSKLEEIRVTVQEKLQSTLEKRLGESFKIVSNQLEMVYKGIGEMQTLATGVGDLKKVLLNVKTRGIWGEVQLENILQQILSESQYVKNAQTNELSGNRVEFVIKIPTKSADNDFILMPIDAKFPLLEYHKLIDFYEKTDKEASAKQLKVLINAIKKEAKNISEKYINPPVTTDFAIMFLPIEGLYAEVVRVPGLLDKIQRDNRVVITSPTTLTAMLNSIQMGFKTFAIEERSTEVWKLLDTVKFEFDNFIGLLNKTKVKLDQASKAIGDAEYKGNIINNKLQNVDKLQLPK
jgi:DNA recombination protein RmuC